MQAQDHVLLCLHAVSPVEIKSLQPDAGAAASGSGVCSPSQATGTWANWAKRRTATEAIG